MARLVDVDELKLELKWLEVDTPVYHDVMSTIDEMPTVETKHGHWINKGFEPTRCSVCGITVDAINGIPWAIKSFKYCPNCGCKMDEVTDEID